MIHLLDCHGKGVPEGVQYIGRVGRTGNPPRSPLSNGDGCDLAAQRGRVEADE